MDGTRRRTLREVGKDIYGLSWLGNASLEEYAVALWMQRRAIQYMYQAPLDVLGNDIFIDFLLVNIGQQIAIEVQGDRWHGGLEQIAHDRDRVKRALQVRPALQVVEVWGHDIVEYAGWPAPTDARFDRVMEAAIRGQQLSQPMIV